MSRVVHFEIHADDTGRCCAFYTKVFGWKIDKWDGPMEYYMATTGPDSEPGINGGIMKRQHPQGSTYNTVAVKSVDAILKKITSSGGKVALPKMAVPGVGWLAYFQDTEGNTMGVLEADPKAK
ncbi:MAG: VOC family protein [Candidatus Lambdaproteobacteria bacterium]|nr:VOC family protein [Candidatus Lambdaproteobacteria bacterium]